jgi:DNA-binding protein YbaB
MSRAPKDLMRRVAKMQEAVEAERNRLATETYDGSLGGGLSLGGPGLEGLLG